MIIGGVPTYLRRIFCAVHCSLCRVVAGFTVLSLFVSLIEGSLGQPRIRFSCQLSWFQFQLSSHCLLLQSARFGQIAHIWHHCCIIGHLRPHLGGCQVPDPRSTLFVCFKQGTYHTLSDSIFSTQALCPRSTFVCADTAVTSCR